MSQPVGVAVQKIRARLLKLPLGTLEQIRVVIVDEMSSSSGQRRVACRLYLTLVDEALANARRRGGRPN